MGYRTYIGKISKTEWEKITDLSKEDLYKLHDEDPEDGWVSMNELCEQLYELGKYTEFDDSKFYTPFFRNTETQDYYKSDHDFHIVGKDFFEHVIEHYSDKVRKYYDEMLKSFWNPETKDFKIELSELTPEYKKSLYLCIEHCRSMAMEWGVTTWWGKETPFNLEKGDYVTTSWKYEYSVFELVRLYKTFDWENDLLIYYGY
jgi:hypothetical protein